NLSGKQATVSGTGQTTVGSHTLTLRAIDACGNTNALDVPFSVINPPPPPKLTSKLVTLALPPVIGDLGATVDFGPVKVNKTGNRYLLFANSGTGTLSLSVDTSQHGPKYSFKVVPAATAQLVANALSLPVTIDAVAGIPANGIVSKGLAAGHAIVLEVDF